MPLDRRPPHTTISPIRPSLLAAFATLLGCGEAREPGDQDALAACAAAESADACAEVDIGAAYHCAWVKTLSLTSEAPCETTQRLQCLAYPTGGNTPTCIPIPGCHGSEADQPGELFSPAYREDESGAIELTEDCGSHPIGWTACNSGAAEDADVPACACVCESAP